MFRGQCHSTPRGGSFLRASWIGRPLRCRHWPLQFRLFGCSLRGAACVSGGFSEAPPLNLGQSHSSLRRAKSASTSLETAQRPWSPKSDQGQSVPAELPPLHGRRGSCRPCTAVVGVAALARPCTSWVDSHRIGVVWALERVCPVQTGGEGPARGGISKGRIRRSILHTETDSDRRKRHSKATFSGPYNGHQVYVPFGVQSDPLGQQPETRAA
ncbi:hypothetical protein M885DRAFT_515877 [Pelagophyceae sp. CCMP2097]|nr:hypothetical protein M885DRAFT_515877 [Pelagophyceae sp. CCMP2097]